jgi:hypothetical protein
MQLNSRPARQTIFPVVFGLLVFAPACTVTGPSYGLPIFLGSTSDEVRKVLGAPTERFRPGTASDSVESISHPGKDEEKVIESYYSVGITCTFSRDRLAAIGLPTYTDYHGFLPYGGTVLNGVKLTDTKRVIIAKLGTPIKIESEALPTGTDPDVPVVWPKESNYYWRLKDYAVQATFLNQAQDVSEHLTFPKDKLISITLTK